MTNAVGELMTYKLMPKTSVLPFAQPVKRADFATKHFWVTPYEPSEKHAAGEYLTQNPSLDVPSPSSNGHCHHEAT